MRVAIIGAGFVGLTVSYRLQARGFSVDLYDAGQLPGGLASGFSETHWEWPLEHFYHHIFTSDDDIIRLSHEVHWPTDFYRPVTSVFYKKNIFPFDSALDLLQFRPLQFIDRLRMGAVLGFLKINPFWKILEGVTADNFLNLALGENGYQTVWKPLLTAKFGPFYKTVSAAWFWARIKKRSPKLGYFKGGFQGFANHLNDLLIQNGVNVFYQSPIKKLIPIDGKVKVLTSSKSRLYDKVLVTTSNDLFLQMVDCLPQDYKKKLIQLQSLDALVCIFELKEKLMEKVYWLNVLDSKYPFVVVTEHTNMIPQRHYSNHHLIYIGGYFPKDHALLTYPSPKVLDVAQKQLTDMFPQFSEENIISRRVFVGKSAQPVFPVSHSKQLVPLETPISNIYLANLSMVYPWDRGTNYAVLLGENLAKLVISKS